MLALLLLTVGPAAHAQPDEQDAKGVGVVDVLEGGFDLVVLRPLGLVGVGAGSVFFAASAPFVAPAGNLPVTWDAFFYAPFEYTFLRPLGTF